MSLGGTFARIAALVLTIIFAVLCLLIALAITITIIALGAGQYYEEVGAGLIMALVGGLPPFLIAVVLSHNARVLRRGVASRAAKIIALSAAIVMGLCAVMTSLSHVGGIFVLLFFLVAVLLAGPLALRSSIALKTPKS